MDLKPRARYDLSVSDSELRLIAKGLAMLAGIEVSTNGGERLEASALNLQMLDQQHRHYQGQVEIAVTALKKAEANVVTTTYSAPAVPTEEEIGRLKAEARLAGERQEP